MLWRTLVCMGLPWCPFQMPAWSAPNSGSYTFLAGQGRHQCVGALRVVPVWWPFRLVFVNRIAGFPFYGVCVKGKPQPRLQFRWNHRHALACIGSLLIAQKYYVEFQETDRDRIVLGNCACCVCTSATRVHGWPRGYAHQPQEGNFYWQGKACAPQSKVACQKTRGCASPRRQKIAQACCQQWP